MNAKEPIALSDEVKEYDKIFEKIAEKRVGTTLDNFTKVNNPFLQTNSTQKNNDTNTTEIKESQENLLEVILANKAKISGKWYSLNESLGAYKLTKIKSNSVILENGIETKELFIRNLNATNIQIYSK